MLGTIGASRRWRGCGTSAFVVRNGAEAAQPVAPKKSVVAKAIDVPTPSSRVRRYAEQISARAAHAYYEVNPPHVGAGEDDYENDLQFKVDDLSSPEAGGAGRAFSRAVCVPFNADPELARPKSGLELQVEQLVAGFGVTAATGSSDGLSAVAAHLRGHGLHASVVAPPKPGVRAPLSTRSIDAPFLMVTRTPGDGGNDDARSDQARSRGPSAASVTDADVVIVDAAVKDYLALAPASPSYATALEAVLPGPVFVGSRARLARAVASLAPAISAAFAGAGMEVPPWRRTSALQHRWAGVEERRRVLELRWEEEAAALAAAAAAGAKGAQVKGEWQGFIPTSSPTATATAWELAQRDQDGDVAPSVVLRAPVLPAAATGATGAAVVPVVGFEVGSSALGSGRVPWLDSEPGAFAVATSALFRRASQPESDDGSASAYSEEAILGLSPVSVFRDGVAVPAAAAVCK